MTDENKITIVTDEDSAYPKRLRDLEDRPRKLFVKGLLPEDDVPAVAIIGARNCSPYGEYTASAFGEYLASKGVNIISGMARGIDGISQRGALKGGGKTFAVLGSGPDVCYPTSNRGLYADILENGGILSIFPPGTAPLAMNFLQRNAIVSGLADLVLVIEARASSGTCNTVEHALRQGRDIYAVPGRITDRLSDGCNILLRQGAGAAISPEDLYRELMILWNRKSCGEVKPKRTPEESSLIIQKMKEARGMLEGTKKGPDKKKKEPASLIDVVDITARSTEEIHKKWKRYHKDATLTETTKELILLCLNGDIQQIGGGYYYKKI